MELQVQIVRQFVKVGEAASKPTEDSGIQLQLLPPAHWHCPLLQPHPLPTFLQSSTREQVASSSRGWSGVELARLCCQWADSRLHRVRVTP